MTRSLLSICGGVGYLMFLISTVVLGIGLASNDPVKVYLGLLYGSTGLVAARGFNSLNKYDQDPFNPMVFWLFFFAFWHLVQPFLNYYVYDISYLQYDYLLRAMWATFIAAVCFEAACVFYRPGPGAPRPQIHLDRRLLLLVPGLMLLLEPVIGKTLRIGGADLAYFIIVFALMAWRLVPTKLARLYAFFLIITELSVLQGEFTRTYIGQVIIIIILYIHYFHKKFKLWHGLFLGTMIVPVMILYGTWRNVEYWNTTNIDKNFINLIEYAYNYFLSISDGKKEIYLLTIALDFPVTYEGFNNVMAYVPRYVDHLWGATYAKILAWPIPRSIWPDKPLSMGVRYLFEFEGALFETTYSVGSLLVGEFYWNFGWLGIVAGMLLVGMIVKHMAERTRTYIQNEYSFACYATWMLTFPMFIRGATANNLAYALFTKILPLIAILVLISAGPRLIRLGIDTGRSLRMRWLPPRPASLPPGE